MEKAVKHFVIGLAAGILAYVVLHDLLALAVLLVAGFAVWQWAGQRKIF